MDQLLEQLLETGLIHLGRFRVSDDQFDPIHITLEYLPSYPELLEEIAQQITLLINSDEFQSDFLLCTPEALPLGVAVSLQSHIPLIYSQRDAYGGYQFHGAFDTHHDVFVLTHIWNEHNEGIQGSYNQAAKRAGLVIQRYLSVFDLASLANELTDLSSYSLINTEMIINYAAKSKRLPELSG